MDFQGIAAVLLNAEASREAIEPLTITYPGLDTEDAYGIQLAGVKLKLAQGQRVIGKKIGLTSKAMREALGVNQPDYGHLFDHMLLSEGQFCHCSELLQPRVEGELAFVLKQTLKGPGVTIADVFRATAGIMPAFEIVDSRIRNWKIKLPDTIADNGSSARLVLGGRLVPIDDLDLRLIGMVLEKNGELASTGAGAAVWGHPAAAVAWLANKLAQSDIALEAGEIILSGAVTAAEAAVPGDVFSLAFDRLGSMNLRFD